MRTTLGTRTVAERQSPVAATGLAIEVRDLRQRYGTFEAVRGISFEVRRGELFALLGTNGAGKTTTLEVLEGFVAASDGQVRVLGHDPYRDRRALRPRLGILLQDGGFLGDLTVAETVDLGRGLVQDTGRRPMDDVLELVGLADKAKTYVRQLSGGQRRRLDLALAVQSCPEVLFLDEPTTGMDPEARRSTWHIIQRLRDAGTTILLTTHYLEEAERLADRLAIMHRGRIHVAGTVEEVVSSAGDRITFRLPANRPELPAFLPDLEGAAPLVTASADDIWVTYALDGGADRTHAALRTLITWADEQGVTLERLGARSGTLEDVFLRVVEEGR
ncbi:ABC transporter ATP-binding protein [Thermasporomyces composti]|uniref:ABC-2 type transport system ATP-binding protein n=1 Tax=Thermasporomyces composti TaxID=696763 RepID=A0A3D9VHP9_THECX|nr:ABC transporter ATP-binding protein [Thermasporomyces composti]REF36831.1 ABC-2 type transport system ATP-binding protein [Thermasporomyces composti]